MLLPLLPSTVTLKLLDKLSLKRTSLMKLLCRLNMQSVFLFSLCTCTAVKTLNLTKHREMQMRTTPKHHLIPVRMAVIKRAERSKCRQRSREKENYTLLLGTRIGAAIMENRTEISQKLKTELPYDPAILLSIYPKEMKYLQ